MPGWLRPAFVLCGLTPVVASVAWAVTRWQNSRDPNCGLTATHASCGLSARDAAVVIAVSAVTAAFIALVVGWVGRRSSWSWVGWSIVAVWTVCAAVYVALPPSG
ncbi:MAG TPA: hypothetical protein VES40_19850 [Ilumatobacteraceae bacterium]|nr:hypothetical protein [Ilumatobacteraceae bacterium]